MATLREQLDEALDDISTVKGCLEDAYTPEAAREELAAAIGKALDTLEDYDSDNDEDSQDEDVPDEGESGDDEDLD